MASGLRKCGTFTGKFAISSFQSVLCVVGYTYYYYYPAHVLSPSTSERCDDGVKFHMWVVVVVA